MESWSVEIVSIRHKGLKHLYLRNDPKGVPGDHVRKIITLIAVLEGLDDIDQFLSLPHGRPHGLKDDRAGDYAISITRNWRMTFRHDRGDNKIEILDLEDYH